MNDLIRKELVELIELMIDKSADKVDRERLGALLRDDVEAQAYYAEQCQLHSMLAWEHGSLPELKFADDMMSSSREARNAESAQSIRHWQGIAIVASLLLVCSLLWTATERLVDFGPKPKTVAKEEAFLPKSGIAWERRDSVGMIAQSFGATLSVADANRFLSQGDVARTGAYELERGIVELRFKSGVDVILEAPARFEIESEMRMVLHEGSVTAQVSPAGEGFVVDTPSMSVVDFGTEFGVEVFADKSSEVHVFEGEVDVKPIHAPPNTAVVKLRTNHATRVDVTGVIPQGINIDHERFIRELDDPNDRDRTYARLISSLLPTVYLRMEFVEDGKTINGLGSKRSTGTIDSGTMEQPPYAPGKVGGSLRFGGPQRRAYAWIDDYPKSKTGQLSVCAWVRAESRPRWAAIAKHWAVELVRGGPANTGLGGQFHFGLHEDEGELEVQVRDRNGMIVELRDSEPLILHEWQHVAFVANGKTLTLYRNGEPVASKPCDGVAVDGPDRLGIAAKLSPDGQTPDLRNPGFWQGRIDELAIFEKALTAEDLANLFKEAPAQQFVP